MKFVGINRTGDFDQQVLAGFGQDIYGDFDQYSLKGVDFGQDFTKDFGIVPQNLEGETFMGYQNQLGVVPEGMGGDFDQMGIVPAGLSGYEHQMGGYHSQLGVVPSGMGTHNYQMGMLADLKTKWATMSPMMKAAAAVAAVLGGALVLRKTGVIKSRLPLIG